MAKVQEFPFRIQCKASAANFNTGGRMSNDGKTSIVTSIKNIKYIGGGMVEINGWCRILDK